MPRPTDLVGLAGSAVVVAAVAVAAGRRLGLRRSRLAVLAGASAVGDLSFTTLVLLAGGLRRSLRGGDPADDRTTITLQGLVLVAGLVLYPLALGLGTWDPYRLGYGNPWLLATLLAVALAALVLDAPLVTFCIALGVQAWALGAFESRNLWDYLIDPLVFVWAAAALLLRVAGAIVTRGPESGRSA
jgi:hypothetical protein